MAIGQRHGAQRCAGLPPFPPAVRIRRQQNAVSEDDMNENERKSISKWLSLILRHSPENFEGGKIHNNSLYEMIN